MIKDQLVELLEAKFGVVAVVFALQDAVVSF